MQRKSDSKSGGRDCGCDGGVFDSENRCKDHDQKDIKGDLCQIDDQRLDIGGKGFEFFPFSNDLETPFDELCADDENKNRAEDPKARGGYKVCDAVQ